METGCGLLHFSFVVMTWFQRDRPRPTNMFLGLRQNIEILAIMNTLWWILFLVEPLVTKLSHANYWKVYYSLNEKTLDLITLDGKNTIVLPECV
jgi:hypothetical protein